MKKIGLVMLCVVSLAGCDPVSLMDANIKNSTSQELTVVFASSIIENKVLRIPSDETVLFQDGMSTTGSFLQPYLAEYDSVYIQSESNEILLVYKQDTGGKNIYDIDNNWSFDEPSKRSYKYEYEIDMGDLE